MNQFFVWLRLIEPLIGEAAYLLIHIVPTTRHSSARRSHSGQAACRPAGWPRVLGVTAESLRTWRRQFAGAQAESAATAAGKLPAVAPSAQELQAEVRRLRAQLQSVSNQRDIFKKAVGIFAGPNGSVSP